MKLVISASLLSAMVFYSSLLPFLHSLNLYISTTIHKNYMFLLCNGLLVFIVRNSGLIGNSSDEQSGRNEALGAAMADGNRKIESKVEIEEERENGLIAKEEENEELITKDEDEEERFNFYEEEEEEEEEEIDEELNKKCEEFIRKMKEGIKFESQQVFVL
ncbi:histone H3.v1-like [Benincasa hispida]|uniref:histone H3.v1-like n=1 Tax=Benincasa hispida TaxID=102211 RepID=UPI0018FFDD7F|nr:histone H3.v1-like [Benincasa hispida]